MTYRQDATHRQCCICAKSIELDEWMVDLFRGPTQVLEWAHETCCRSAIEAFLTKKRAREASAPPPV